MDNLEEEARNLLLDQEIASIPKTAFELNEEEKKAEMEIEQPRVSTPGVGVVTNSQLTLDLL